MFRAWLDEHYPDRAAKVMATIRSLRGGRDNDPNFFSRMRGQGPWADLLRTRFEIAAKKYGLRQAKFALRTDLFVPPAGRPDAAALIDEGPNLIDRRCDFAPPLLAPKHEPYLFAALLPFGRPCLAQQSTSTLPPPVLIDPRVAALRDDALENDHYAWDITEGLTTEVGQRLAATEAEARARDWAVRRADRDRIRQRPCRALHHARLDARGGKRRDRPPSPRSWLSRRWATAARPAPKASLARSPISPASMRFAWRPKALSGQDRVHRPPYDAGAGRLGLRPVRRPRRQGPTIASLKGALAIVIRSIGTDHHRNPHTGVQYFTDGASRSRQAH